MSSLVQRALQAAVHLFALSLGLFYSFWVALSMLPRALRHPIVALTKNPHTKEYNAGTWHAFTTSDGLTLRYMTMGNIAASDRIAVFLHGFPESVFCWHKNLPSLSSRGLFCVALEMRGYGKSSKPTDRASYRVERLATDVKELLEDFARRKPTARITVVGHDWGGVVAWEVAERFPETMHKLVILNCPHPKAYLQGFSVNQFLKSWYFFFFFVPFVPEFLLSLFDYAPLVQAVRGDLKKTKAALSEDDIESMKFFLSQPGAVTAMINYYRENMFSVPNLSRKMSSEDAKRRVTVPTLMLFGDADRAIGTDHIPFTRRFVDTIEIKIFKGISHWINQEIPDEINAEILAFAK